jgi:hypothetical protein
MRQVIKYHNLHQRIKSSDTDENKKQIHKCAPHDAKASHSLYAIFSEHWSLRDTSRFHGSEFRFDSACAHEAPAADGFINGEQSRCHKNNSQPEFVVNDDDPPDEAQRAGDTARKASVAVKIGFEEPAHGRNITRRVAKAKSCR